MSTSTSPPGRRLPADFYAALSALPVKLRNDAGWRRLSLAAVISVASALVADFVKPVVWVVPYVTISALLAFVVGAGIYWWLRKSGAVDLLWLPARTVIISGLVAVVFGGVWSAQAAVPANETLTGQFLRTALELQDSLKDLEDTVERVGQEVGRVRVLMEEGAAREALQRAQDTRDYADYGQVTAIESLLAAGRRLERANLTGMDLRDVRLPEASLVEATLTFAWLNSADFKRANLSGANLIVSTLDGADLNGASLRDARLVLARAEGTNFGDVQGDNANFSGARLQGANFRGASLRQARFAFADLTDADFTDADLREAVFIGARLDGANFAGAKLGNTDVTGVAALPSTLTESSDGVLCRTATGAEQQGVQVLVIEMIPSSRFQGGIEHNRMFERWLYYDATTPAGLRTCRSREYAEDWSFPIWRYEGKDILSQSFGLRFRHELLEVGGRRSELVNRIREYILEERG